VPDPPSFDIDAALESERQFVLTLGGFALEVSGAALVTHEKIPVPRFNFVQEVGVGAERQTAFFERALDHYFQRALRPTFRVSDPPAPHVDRGLRRLGFRPRTEPLVLMLDGGARPPPAPVEFSVRPAADREVDRVSAFWTHEKERPEFRAALDIAWHHPNPAERLVPLFALRDDEPVSAALAYRFHDSVGIHAVTTRTEARGQGAASALVAWTLAHHPAGDGVRYSIFSDSPRLERRLVVLGFHAARRFREYELPADAELALPPPGPPEPPRWRPPRDRAPPRAD